MQSARKNDMFLPSESTDSLLASYPMMSDNLQRLREMLLGALKPVPDISITEWAEQNIYLPKKVTSEEGPFRIARTPYLREIMDCMHPSNPINEVIVWSGTQLGKTQSIFNSVFFNIVNAPAGILFGFSNTEEMKKMIQNRFDPIVDANPIIRERIFAQRAGRSGDTLNFKDFPGGDISFASGEAPAAWISNPRRYIYIDEADAMPKDLNGKGDVYELAKDRVSSWGNRYKIYMSSTTTNKSSRIKKEYELTEMSKYFVPCPHCGHYQLIDWARFHWEVDNLIVNDVWMDCEECGYHIHDYDKEYMLPRGEWRATNPLPTPKNKRGFWISGLYAPVGWQSWKGCVETYLKATRDRDVTKLTAFFNSILAMPYEEYSDRPDWQRLYNLSRGSGYISGQIPKDVLFLTSATDVQENRLETEIKGWCRNGRSKSIATFKFFCRQDEKTDTISAKCWDEYQSTILDGQFIREDGVCLRTVQNAIDRSYNTITVNAFWQNYCRIEESRGLKGDYRLTQVRGRDNTNDIISSFKLDKPGQKGAKRLSKNKKRKDGVFFFIDVGVSVLKTQIYKDLNEEDNVERTKPNIMIFPADYDEEFFKQLTAEEWIPPDSKHKHGHWDNPRHRNEALDLSVYNRAMWYLIGAYEFTDANYDYIESQYSMSKKAVKAEVQRKKKATVRVLNKGGDIY